MTQGGSWGGISFLPTGGKKAPSAGELEETDVQYHYEGIPKTEEELKRRTIKNVGFPTQLQSEAFG